MRSRVLLRDRDNPGGACGAVCRSCHTSPTRCVVASWMPREVERAPERACSSRRREFRQCTFPTTRRRTHRATHFARRRAYRASGSVARCSRRLRSIRSTAHHRRSRARPRRRRRRRSGFRTPRQWWTSIWVERGSLASSVRPGARERGVAEWGVQRRAFLAVEHEGNGRHRASGPRTNSAAP